MKKYSLVIITLLFIWVVAETTNVPATNLSARLLELKNVQNFSLDNEDTLSLVGYYSFYFNSPLTVFHKFV